MHITWVVVASGIETRIYALGKEHGTLVQVHQIDHPAGRLKVTDLIEGRPGRFHARGHYTGEAFEIRDPKETELHFYANQIADYLNAGRNSNQYEHIILMAAPHLLGILNESLNPHVDKKVTKRIHKDYSHLTVAELYDKAREKEE